MTTVDKVESEIVSGKPGKVSPRQLASGGLVRYLPLIMLAVIIIVIGILSPNFLTARNAINILRQSAALGLMAIGMTAVLVGGGIDLSLPSVMAFSGILGAMYMRDGGNPVLAAAIMIVVGTLSGCINGFAVAYLRMIPFVVTLAMMNIAMGASIWITESVSVAPINQGFIDVVMAKFSIIPIPVIFVAIVTILAQALMKNSLFGRWLFAVGTNARAARVSGIPTTPVIFGTYAFSGFMAGMAAIVVVARLMSAAPTMTASEPPATGVAVGLGAGFGAGVGVGAAGAGAKAHHTGRYRGVFGRGYPGRSCRTEQPAPRLSPRPIRSRW